MAQGVGGWRSWRWPGPRASALALRPAVSEGGEGVEHAGLERGKEARHHLATQAHAAMAWSHKEGHPLHCSPSKGARRGSCAPGAESRAATAKRMEPSACGGSCTLWRSQQAALGHVQDAAACGGCHEKRHWASLTPHRAPPSAHGAAAPLPRSLRATAPLPPSLRAIAPLPTSSPTPAPHAATHVAWHPARARCSCTQWRPRPTQSRPATRPR